MAFSMTLLSWSLVEYSAKYKAVGEYDHVRELIRWGTDYLLRTFNSSASTIGHVYAQVAVIHFRSPDPEFWSCGSFSNSLCAVLICWLVLPPGGSCKD